MSSQQRRTKRPRSDQSLADKKNAKKPRAKVKKGKVRGISNDAFRTALESTATPEGALMAQALSTFSALELSRFEAFRRSTFRGDAVSNFVAFRLAEHQERRFAAREGTRRLVGAAGLGVNASSGRTAAALRFRPHVVDCCGADGGGGGVQGDSGGGVACAAADAMMKGPRLEDLVAPNSAQEITVVTSALAKCYAQRLVTAARRVAAAEGYPDGARILPRHLLEAHRHRSLAGIDPGFFLQPPSHSQRLRGMGSGSSIAPLGISSASAAALGITDKHKLKYAAALWAQEQYDKIVENEEKDTDEGEPTVGSNSGRG